MTSLYAHHPIRSIVGLRGRGACSAAVEPATKPESRKCRKKIHLGGCCCRATVVIRSGQQRGWDKRGEAAVAVIAIAGCCPTRAALRSSQAASDNDLVRFTAAVIPLKSLTTFLILAWVIILTLQDAAKQPM
jgi:hypothetical protein